MRRWLTVVLCEPAAFLPARGADVCARRECGALLQRRGRSERLLRSRARHRRRARAPRAARALVCGRDPRRPRQGRALPGWSSDQPAGVYVQPLGDGVGPSGAFMKIATGVGALALASRPEATGVFYSDRSLNYRALGSTLGSPTTIAASEGARAGGGAVRSGLRRRLSRSSGLARAHAAPRWPRRRAGHAEGRRCRRRPAAPRNRQHVDRDLGRTCERREPHARAAGRDDRLLLSYSVHSCSPEHSAS